MRAWRTDALTRYDRNTSRYHAGVYQRKRTNLLAALDAARKVPFTALALATPPTPDFALARRSAICTQAINFTSLPHAQVSSDPSYPRSQQARPAANAMTPLPKSQHAGLLRRLARTHAEAPRPTAVP
ncbi:hypothetical protein B0H15DRAFT_951258 [Mycena belliarum]|uniref:Uncharacterized protein n=1 Tax=Mycena belliarum TaxID=1033014 RepID=A0AAD6U140_9AGAR|nr:hypothetical protein B0H15DRAFT_951258 [Mycena belliae]